VKEALENSPALGSPADPAQLQSHAKA